MSLIDRVRSSFLSNVDSIARRVESSTGSVSGLLEQMAQEITKAKQELVRLLAEEKLLRKRAAERLEQAQQWLTRAELAIRKGEDALARDALVQRKRIASEANRDTAAASEHAESAQTMRDDIRSMESKHASWSARKATIETTFLRSQVGGGVESLGASPGSNAFDDLKQVERVIETSEFENAARDEVDQLLSPSPAAPAGQAGVGDGATPRRRVRVE